jgi:hypothetical protein
MTQAHAKSQGDPARHSPVIVGLLAGILVAILVLVVVIWTRSPAGDDGHEKQKPDPPVAVKSGESTTRQQVESQGVKLSKPREPVDAARVQATYEVGKKYRSLIHFDLKGRGTATDWGITLNSNFLYLGEMLTTRAIESNDGKTIVLTQTFDRAENLRIATQIENLDFSSPGWAGELTLMFTDWAGSAGLGLSPGWSRDIRSTAQFLADTPLVKNMLSRVATDNDAKVMAFLSSLQGKQVRITYINGKGVEKIEPLGCDLSEQERDLIFATAVISDIYILPDLNEMKQPWTIRAEDVLPVVDPSLHAHLTGGVSASRGPDEGSGDDRKAVVKIDPEGYFELEGFDKDKNAVYGRWMPTGKMLFSFKDKIVTSGTLGGSFALEQHSTTHWIFEARFATRPTYTVTYSCAVVP